MGNPDLVKDVKGYIGAEPRFFADVIGHYAKGYSYRELLLAWSDIREEDVLKRDKEGRYLI
jgi:hypothetical protein